MATQSELRLSKVQKFSVWLRRLFQCLSVAIILAIFAKALFILIGDETYSNVRIGLTTFSGDSIPWIVHAIAWTGSFLAMAIALKLSFHLVRLFGHYAGGMIFEKENVQQIRQIGVSVLLFALLWVVMAISPAFIPVDGQSALLEADGAGPFIEIVAGIVILVVSWIMDVGREIREDRDLVV